MKQRILERQEIQFDPTDESLPAPRGKIGKKPQSRWGRKIVGKDRQIDAFESSNIPDGSYAACEYCCLVVRAYGNERFAVFERSKPGQERQFIVARIPKDWPTGESLFDPKLCSTCNPPGTCIQSFNDEQEAIQALARWAGQASSPSYAMLQGDVCATTTSPGLAPTNT